MQLTDLSDRQLQTWQQYIDIFAEIQPEIQQRMQPNEQYKHCVDLRLDNKYINPYWIITDQCRLYSIYGNKIRQLTFVKDNNNIYYMIDKIRKQYDPLAELVRPHITLVFPFENEMNNEELEQILNKRLQGIKPFELKLSGISKQEDTFGNYLFLEVIQGIEEVNYIHQVLYDNEFKKFDLGLKYIPHMTIGKLPTAELLNEAYNNIKSVNDTFSTIVKKVSVEMIGDNEESIIIIERELV